MATDLRTTQEYLNDKLGTVGLTKQQCLIRLAGLTEQDSTFNRAANAYAGTLGLGYSGQNALNIKVAESALDLGKQEAARRL